MLSISRLAMAVLALTVFTAACSDDDADDADSDGTDTTAEPPVAEDDRDELASLVDAGPIALSPGSVDVYCEQVGTVRAELGLDTPGEFSHQGFVRAVITMSEMTPPEEIAGELETVLNTYLEVAEVYSRIPDTDSETIDALPDEDKEKLDGLGAVSEEVAAVEDFTVEACGIGLTGTRAD